MRPDVAFNLSVVCSGMVGKHTSDYLDLEENDQNPETKIRNPKSKIHMLMSKYHNSKIENPKSKIQNYPSLPKSYKKAFPFKIGTTSYIFPDHIIPNVRAIGPYVDEIELILFESNPESLPTGREIKMLETLSKDLDITYNIHLPLDVYLGSHDDIHRKESIEILRGIFDLTAPLSPTTHTLHLAYDGTADEEDRHRWESNLFVSFEELLSKGIDGESISVETLSYPLNWIDDIIEAFHLNVCLDVGHLLLTNTSLSDTINRYCDRISIYHLHGVKEGRDHHSINNLPKAVWHLLLDMLKRFKGVVSIEVFSFDRLNKSLYAFENHWNHFIQWR